MHKQQEDIIQVQRWRKKYDGTVKSLANKSRRPKSYPNSHTKEELYLISKKYKKYKRDGLAQVFRKYLNSGYKRSLSSMCKQIKNMKIEKEKTKNIEKS